MIVGYKLIVTSTGDVVETWGGTWNQCPSMPEILTLPNGDQVCAPTINEDYGNYRLIEWEMAYPEATARNVIAERSRRLAVGFNYAFSSGVKHIGTSEEDMQGWNEVTSWANAQVALGDTTSTINILTDNGPETVTALQWLSVVNAATAFRQPIWAASFALQGMNPIPEDFPEDKWWPVDQQPTPL